MIRSHQYQLDATGDITPKTTVFGGYVGEHNATALVFTLSDALKTVLFQRAQTDPVQYRFEVSDAAKRLYHLPPEQLGNSSVPTLALTNAFTETAGTVTVDLIFEIAAQTNSLTLYSFPVTLNLLEAVNGQPSTPTAKKTVADLFKEAQDRVDEMQAILDSATDLLDQCETVAQQAQNKATAAHNDAQAAAGSATLANTKAQLAVSNAQTAAEKATLAAASQAAAKASEIICTQTEETLLSMVDSLADQAYVDQRIDSFSSGISSLCESLYQSNQTLGQRVSTLEAASGQSGIPDYTCLARIGGSFMDTNFDISFNTAQTDVLVQIQVDGDIDYTLPSLQIKFGNILAAELTPHYDTSYLIRLHYIGEMAWETGCDVATNGQGAQEDCRFHPLYSLSPFRLMKLNWSAVLPEGVRIHIYYR